MDDRPSIETSSSDVLVLCGLRGNGAQLEFLQALLSEAEAPIARRCLIDNRDLRVPPSVTEIASMVRLASDYSGRLEDVRIAWVSKHDCRFDPAADTSLPLRFHHFRSLESARSWLRAQP